MRRRDEDGAGLFHPGQVSGPAAIRGRAAPQQFPDECDAFFQLARRQTRRSQVSRPAVTGADAEHGAARSEQVDRRDGRRRYGGMARD